MNWINIKRNSFKYSGKVVNRKKVIAKTIFGTFEVFESVGGNCFLRHPFLKSNYITDLSGLGEQFKGTFFDNGLEDWFGKSKKPCENIKDGIKICEQVMSKIKTAVNSY